MPRLIIILLVLSSNAFAFAPIEAPKPNLTHQKAYLIVLEEMKLSADKAGKLGLLPKSISYTNHEYSEMLSAIKKANKHAKSESLQGWGWLISVANHKSLEHESLYFVTQEGECILVTHID